MCFGDIQQSRRDGKRIETVMVNSEVVCVRARALFFLSIGLRDFLYTDNLLNEIYYIFGRSFGALKNKTGIKLV